MDITSSSSSTSRFRFRDHTSLQKFILANQDSVNEELGHATTDSSSVSSDCDVDTELESMTAQGIQNLCSELVELKNESDEDFQKNIFSSYSAFLGIFEEMEGLESELMQLKHQASTQKSIIKDLTESISVKVLSEEMMEVMLEESLHAQTHFPSVLEAHTEDVSEILDILLSEHRLDEALSVLEMESRAFQSTHFRENFSSEELMSYNSAISEKRSMLADQLTLLAKSPRVSAPELQQALVGLCKLSNSHLATRLLLDYYQARIACGTHDLHSSKAFPHGQYIRELAKFVFSMISQAARSFVALHGETSSHTPELVQWASEQTEVFAACLTKYLKSISEISGGLSTAVEAVQCALSYCSLLENEKLVLRSCLIDHIRPCVEHILHIHVDHFKKVMSIFTSTDSWILGRYLVSGIFGKGSSSILVDKKPEYCLLTNSGRKFVTLFQAITYDSSPLVALQMEVSVLRELMDLFTKYINILEKALTTGSNLIEKDGSRIHPADSLVQGVSVLANSFTLVQFFSNIIRRVFGDIHQLKFEIDNYILFIQDTHVRLRAHFFEQVIQKLLYPEGGHRPFSESYASPQNDSDICQLVPSMPYQVNMSSQAYTVFPFWSGNNQRFYVEIRKLQKFAEDNYIEMDWLMDLLCDLMEAIFIGITNREEILTVSEDVLMEENYEILMQLILDTRFLVEVARCGGYLSDNIMNASLEIVSRIKSCLGSYQFTRERHVDDQRWAEDAAITALQKLIELDEKKTISNEIANNLEDETNESESLYSTDLFEDDDRTTCSRHSLESSKDMTEIHALEKSSHTETKISEIEDSILEGDIDLERESFDDSSAVDCFEPYGERLLEIERDEYKLRNLDNNLLETHFAVDDVEETSMDKISSPRDDTEERMYIQQDLHVSTSGTLAVVGAIDVHRYSNEQNNSEKTSAVLEEED